MRSFKLAPAPGTLCALVLAILSNPPAQAEVLQFPFTSSAMIETSDAVVNTRSGKIHPQLQADQWDDDGGSLEQRAFSVEDGRHGLFDSTTYLSFNDGPYNGDKVIRINTDVYQALYFKDFTLDVGWTIKPVGSRPLVIYSLGKITIHGTIDCSGGSGEDVRADNTMGANGGTGRCGGGAGGAGGTTTVAADSGFASDLNPPVPGAGAIVQGFGGSGGGGFTGGGINGMNLSDVDSGSGGGANLSSDPAIRNISGGAGGGGGAHYANGAALEIPFHSSGAGGGGGGGSIYLYAVDEIYVKSTGLITANGGDGGGEGTGSYKGGGGGGGGGGTILIFTSGNFIVDGDVTAIGGDGGTTSGGDGGDGGDGRTWVNDSDGMPDGTNLLAPTPGATVPIYGVVNYERAQYTVVSKIIDLDNFKPLINSISVDSTVPPGSSLILEVAGADTEFGLSDAVWVPAASVSSLSGKRYLRFRIKIDNQDNTTPVEVRSVSIDYTKSDKGKFEFASCALVGALPPPGSSSLGWFSALLLAPLALLLRLRSARSSPADS